MTSTSLILGGLGCVVIGRNEGERLLRCLDSLRRHAARVVYVDSGSTDGSVEAARARGADVVALDTSRPFTAARARNSGWARLAEVVPNLQFVQFVDGDCEVDADWLPRAHTRLVLRAELAAVCGRRRERFPERSIYNRVCDVEWDTPIGDTASCGGDAMMRHAALEQVGGFDPGLIAGEEPDLCVRLRARGWKIERLDAEMTLHDAAMTQFSQWWRRAVRAGHAFAEGAALHGAPPERHFVRERNRSILWGAALPAVALGAAIPTLGASTALFLGYPVSAARTYAHTRRRGRSRRDAAVTGVLLTVGKLAELQGIMKYHASRLRGERTGLIEYKKADG